MARIDLRGGIDLPTFAPPQPLDPQAVPPHPDDVLHLLPPDSRQRLPPLVTDVEAEAFVEAQLQELNPQFRIDRHRYQQELWNAVPNAFWDDFMRDGAGRQTMTLQDLASMLIGNSRMAPLTSVHPLSRADSDEARLLAQAIEMSMDQDSQDQ
eukprot:TRINITY_DN2788_c0_g1_i14.p1 TRINITY_DN2788_c0_g1~~TRINITY_DN2788_c0_g1_i14.p1  ORF type:complete len:153 (-),score=32.52 TRINITY_DN2788_c0_g1_i14:68-526(-)